jgi:hypothetical protein
MSCRAADNPEAIDAISMRWDFKVASLFPPIPLLKRVMRKLELSRRDVSPRHSVLGGPDLVRQSPGASSGGRPPSSLHQRPRHQLVDRGASSIPGAAVPSCLEDLGESTPSRTGPFGFLQQDEGDPQRTATKGLGSPSRPSSALPPFLSIKRL